MALLRVGDGARLVVARRQRDRAGRRGAVATFSTDDAGVVGQIRARDGGLSEGVGADVGDPGTGGAAVADVRGPYGVVDRPIESAVVIGRGGALAECQLRHREWSAFRR